MPNSKHSKGTHSKKSRTQHGAGLTGIEPIDNATDAIVKALGFGSNQDADGNTPLHIAARDGKFDVVKDLVTNGKVDLAIQNKKGNTAVHEAVVNNHHCIAQYLLEHGAPNVQNGKGEIVKTETEPEPQHPNVSTNPLDKSKTHCEHLGHRIDALKPHISEADHAELKRMHADLYNLHMKIHHGASDKINNDHLKKEIEEKGTALHKKVEAHEQAISTQLSKLIDDNKKKIAKDYPEQYKQYEQYQMDFSNEMAKLQTSSGQEAHKIRMKINELQVEASKLFAQLKTKMGMSGGNRQSPTASDTQFIRNIFLAQNNKSNNTEQFLSELSVNLDSSDNVYEFLSRNGQLRGGKSHGRSHGNSYNQDLSTTEQLIDQIKNTLNGGYVSPTPYSNRMNGGGCGCGDPTRNMSDTSTIQSAILNGGSINNLSETSIGFDFSDRNLNTPQLISKLERDLNIKGGFMFSDTSTFNVNAIPNNQNSEINTEMLIQNIKNELNNMEGGRKKAKKAKKSPKAKVTGTRKINKGSKHAKKTNAELTYLVNNQTNDIIDRAKAQIGNLIKDNKKDFKGIKNDEDTVRAYKAALWKMTKEKNPTLTSALDVAIEMEKLVSVDVLKKIDINMWLKTLKEHYDAKQKSISEREKNGPVSGDKRPARRPRKVESTDSSSVSEGSSSDMSSVNSADLSSTSSLSS